MDLTNIAQATVLLIATFALKVLPAPEQNVFVRSAG